MTSFEGYVYIKHSRVSFSPSNQLINRGLDIRNTDGTLMAFVCNAMPTHLKATLSAKLIACLGEDDILVWRQGGDETPFEGLHFSWYNRYTTNVSPHISS